MKHRFTGTFPREKLGSPGGLGKSVARFLLVPERDRQILWNVKVSGTFCLKGRSGASHKRCLTPSAETPGPAACDYSAASCRVRRPAGL